MRFLADESCDFRVIRALRNAGHDVTAVIELSPGADDDTVIDMAMRDQRIFLTEDRDFGQLVYAASKMTTGVIFFRYPTTARSKLPGLVVDFVARYGEKLAEHFVVFQPGHIRFAARPF